MLTSILRHLKKQHIDSGKDISLVYKPVARETLNLNHPKERIIEFDENHNLVKLLENEQANNGSTVNTSLGMYLLSVDVLNGILDRAIEDDIYTSIDELIQYHLLNYSVNPFEYTGYIENINSVQSYYQANMNMLTRSNFAALFHTSLPVLTKSKNGNPTYYGKNSEVKKAIVASSAYLAGTVERSVIHRGVAVQEGAFVKNSVILQGTKIGENARIEYAVIDKDCVIEAGAQVIGTPDNVLVIEKNSLIEASAGAEV